MEGKRSLWGREADRSRTKCGSTGHSIFLLIPLDMGGHIRDIRLKDENYYNFQVQAEPRWSQRILRSFPHAMDITVYEEIVRW